MNDTPTNYVTIGNYRISRADDRNLQVDEFRLVKAKPGRYVKEARETEKWVFRGYFSGLTAAAQGVLRYMNDDAVDDENVKSLNDLIVAVGDNQKFLAQALHDADLQTEDFVK